MFSLAACRYVEAVDPITQCGDCVSLAGHLKDRLALFDKIVRVVAVESEAQKAGSHSPLQEAMESFYEVPFCF